MDNEDKNEKPFKQLDLMMATASDNANLEQNTTLGDNKNLEEILSSSSEDENDGVDASHNETNEGDTEIPIVVLNSSKSQNEEDTNTGRKRRHQKGKSKSSKKKTEETKQPVDNNKTENKEIIEELTGFYTIQFHAYAPSEFQIDEENFQFVLNSSYHEWNESLVVPLKHRKWKDGFIVTGEMKLPKSFCMKEKTLDYKYAVREISDDALIHEHVPYHKGNRILKLTGLPNDRNFKRYDGLILPPDEGNKTSSIWKKMKKLAEKVVKTFGTKDLFFERRFENFDAMLYELEESLNDKNEKTLKLETLTKYLNTILESGKRIYSSAYYNNTAKLEQDFIIRLLTIVSDNTNTYLEKNCFVISIGILYFITSIIKSHYYFEIPCELLQCVLQYLRTNDLPIIAETFSGETKNTYLENFYKLYTYRDLSKYSVSINLLKIVLYLKFGDKIFNTENYEIYFDIELHYFSLEIFQFIAKTEKLYQSICDVDNIPKPVLMLSAWNSIFQNKEIVEKYIDKFQIDQVLWFLYQRINERLFYGRVDVLKIFKFSKYGIETFSFMFQHTLKKTLEQDVKNLQRDYVAYLLEMTNLIIHEFSSFKSIFEESTYYVGIALRIIKISLWLMNAKIDSIEISIINLKYFTEMFLNSNNKRYSINHVQEREFVFKAWTDILRTESFADKNSYDLLKRIVLNQCSDILSKQTLHTIMELCVDVNSSSYHHHSLKQTLLDVVISKIDKNMKKPDIQKITNLTKHDKSLMENIALKIFNAKWPKSEIDTEIFSFLFDCTDFLKTFLMIDEKCNLENKDLELRFTQAKSFIEINSQSLLEGDIQNHLIKLINKNMNSYIELCLLFKNEIKSALDFKPDDNLESLMKNIIMCRKAELDNFIEFFNLVSRVVQFTKSQAADSVDLKNIEDELTKFNELDKIRLKDVCQVIDAQNLSNFLKNKADDSRMILQIHLTCFKVIQSNMISSLKHIIELNKNQIFNLLIKNSTKAYKKEHKTIISFGDYINLILLKAYDQWLSFSKDLCKGELKFKDIFNYTKTLNNWKQEFTILMNHSQLDNQTIELRLKQINIYQKLEGVSDVSEMLFNIKKIFKLTGNFDKLDEIRISIQDENFEDTKISDINDNVFDIYSKLDKLSSDEMKDCLNAFLRNIDFIEWLRGHAPNEDALKLLADFAAESENEGALEVRRVQTLLLVGNAYGPLIYHLDKNSDFDTLLKRVDNVRVNLETNPELPNRINVIAQEKSWLEDIKESKQNTGLNSLKQATRINLSGVYIVGIPEEKLRRKEDKIELKDIIELSVPGDQANKINPKKYKYSEIVDLHDKLTLVVGKSDDQQITIKYFEDILEGVIGLAENYLLLLKSGNILFKNWTATVYCDEQSQNTIKINFGITNENKNIFGYRIEEETTINSINKVIKYLNDCYKEWLEHINEKRSKYPLLNYFSLDQLVILREELTKINANTNGNMGIDNERNLLDLLYNLNESVDVGMTVEANEYACEQMALSKKSVAVAENKVPSLNEDEVDALIEKMTIDWGFTKKLINHAIKNAGSTDYQALVEFCLSNEQAVIEEKSTGVDSVSLKMQLDDFNVGLNEPDSLMVNIKQLWDKFKELLDQNLVELLCLDHLGHFFKYLKDKSTKKINRTKPAYLEYGLPNLVVCDEWEIIPRIMNLYMLSPEQPLPNDEEILFCTETTTANEVEIFFRRAVSNQNEEESDAKIYCLANVQALEYDQAVKTVITFENMLKRRNFVFCIFCSREKSDKSVVATSFNRYKKKLPDTINLAEIEEYLKEKFKHYQKGVAASVDKDSLTARVIKSERSGVA